MRKKRLLMIVMAAIMLFGAGCNVKQPPVIPTDADAAAVAAAKTALTWDGIKNANAAQDGVTGNLTLPAEGADGVAITWASDKPAVVSNAGVVERPAYEAGDAVAVLTATLAKGEKSDTKQFTITVKALDKDDTGGESDDPYDGKNPYEGMNYGDMIINETAMKNRLINDRWWAGCPSIERTAGGRLYMSNMSGGNTEPEKGNYVTLFYSDDEGGTWEPVAIAYNGNKMYDCGFVWIDPLGRLWWAYANYGYTYQGGECYVGVIEYPDRPEPIIAPPRQIGYGFALNKPTATSDGRWLFPLYVMPWMQLAGTIPGYTGRKDYPYVYETADEGKTFRIIGHVENVADRNFDETMILEKSDGSLSMYHRTNYGIAISRSTDGGSTWTDAADSGIPGPNSRFHIRRLKSGRVLLINNDHSSVRCNMTAMLSDDDGATWPHKLVMDARTGVSYPDATQAADGSIYIAYDIARTGPNRQLFLSKITEADIIAGSLTNAGSYIGKVVEDAYTYSGAQEGLAQIGDKVTLDFESESAVIISDAKPQIDAQIVSDTSGIGASFGKALQVTFASSGDSTWPFLTFNGISLNPNLSYSLTFDYKVLQASAYGFTPMIREIDDPWRNTGDNRVSLAAVSADVEKYSARLDVGAWGKTYLKLQFSAENRVINGKILIDNLVLEVIDPPYVFRQLADKRETDFETQPPFIFMSNTGIVDLSVVDDYSGYNNFGKALEIKLSGAGQYALATLGGVTIGTNLNFRITFDYKVITPSDLPLHIMFREDSGSYRSIRANIAADASKVGTVQQFSAELNTQFFNVSQTRLQIGNFNSTAMSCVILIDNLKVEVIGAM